MCFICLMIDQSLPNPKSLVSSVREFNTPDEHIPEILDKVFDILPENEAINYTQDVLDELYLDHLRNT